MKTYNVTQYHIQPNQQRRTVLVQAIDAPAAQQAISYAYPGIQPTAAPDEDVAEWRAGPTRDGITVLIEAEPADREDLTPAPQSPQFGALREAIARALIAEQLCEAAVAELARVAGLPVDTAYTCMLSLSEWIPGDPITDEQCKAFVETPQEPAE